MKLQKGKQYRIRWIDAFQLNEWTADDKELDKTVALHEKPITQTLYLIKSTAEFHLFTSGVHKATKDNFDVIGIPKGWIVDIKPIR